MAPGKGHKLDSQRSREPPYISQPLPIQAERWRPFVRDFAREDDEHRSIVSGSFMDRVWNDYSDPYMHHRGEKGTTYHRTMLEILLNDPWVPGLIRILMFTLSAVTLGLGGRLLFLDHDNNGICEASPTMVVVLAGLAIVYLPYIFYDEYFGSPIGIRRPLSKARLLFFDLLFVVVYSVNTTLAAFEALTNTCTAERRIEVAVFGVVLVTLIAWIATFSVTLIRLIARIGARYDVQTGG